MNDRCRNRIDLVVDALMSTYYTPDFDAEALQEVIKSTIRTLNACRDVPRCGTEANASFAVERLAMTVKRLRGKRLRGKAGGES